jgi:hypothetical protein
MRCLSYAYATGDVYTVVSKDVSPTITFFPRHFSQTYSRSCGTASQYVKTITADEEDHSRIKQPH